MPIVNGHRRLLSAEAEKKLKSELEALLKQRNENHQLSMDDIAEALRFGIPGTPYENLKTGHVCYYAVEFGFEYHTPLQPDPPQPKHNKPQPKKSIDEQQQWEQQLRKDMNTLWFSGCTPTEMSKILHLPEPHVKYYLDKFFRPKINRIPSPQYIQSLKTFEIPEPETLVTVVMTK
jgi:hypothetical protein